ncbi:hypothetical protein [Nocardia macrotermitis]|nr:hypothetical protein [Nocardia macrotermitis]
MIEQQRTRRPVPHSSPSATDIGGIQRRTASARDTFALDPDVSRDLFDPA